jgi:hypothetical protein
VPRFVAALVEGLGAAANLPAAQAARLRASRAVELDRAGVAFASGV